MTITKTSRRRPATTPALAEHGMNPGETRHLHRAISTVVANLSPKQLELRAEDLMKYLQHRRHILELPEHLFENAEAKPETLHAIAVRLASAPPTPTMLDRRLGWLARSMRLSAPERAVLGVMARRAVFGCWTDLMDLLPFRASLPNVAALSAITGYSLTAVDGWPPRGHGVRRGCRYRLHVRLADQRRAFSP